MSDLSYVVRMVEVQDAQRTAQLGARTTLQTYSGSYSSDDLDTYSRGNRTPDEVRADLESGRCAYF